MSELLRLESTLNCISVSLDVATDLLPKADGTIGPGSVPQSVANLKFRKVGDTDWIDAQPLCPIKTTKYHGGKKANYSVDYYTGSILFLSPGTHYEVLVTLRGITYTKAVRTRMDVDQITPHGLIRQVPTALDANNNAIISEGGPDEDNPVVYDGEGMYLDCNRLIVNAPNVLVRNLKLGGQFNIRANNVRLHDCVLDDTSYLVMVYGNNATITNCKLLGNETTDINGYAGEGVQTDKKNRGTVVKGCEIRGVADAYSYGWGNIDFIDNVVHTIVDDLFESDENWDNLRCYGNIFAGDERLTHEGVRPHNGFSMQPMNSGPWYIIGNAFRVAPEMSWVKKGKAGGPVFFANNYVRVNSTSNQAYIEGWFNKSLGCFCNNVFLSEVDYRLARRAGDYYYDFIKNHGRFESNVYIYPDGKEGKLWATQDGTLSVSQCQAKGFEINSAYATEADLVGDGVAANFTTAKVITGITNGGFGASTWEKPYDFSGDTPVDPTPQPEPQPEPEPEDPTPEVPADCSECEADLAHCQSLLQNGLQIKAYLEAEIASLETQNATLVSQVNSLASQISVLEVQLQTLTLAGEAAQEEVDRLNSELSTCSQALSALQEDSGLKDQQIQNLQSMVYSRDQQIIDLQNQLSDCSSTTQEAAVLQQKLDAILVLIEGGVDAQIKNIING